MHRFNKLVDLIPSFEAFLYWVKLGTRTRFSRKVKFAGGDKQIFTFRKLSFAFTVIAALVHLMPGDRAVEFRIGFLVWYVTGDPILNPCEYLFGWVMTDDGHTFYPQQNMIMRCTTSLILVLPVMTGHLTKHLFLE